MFQFPHLWLTDHLEKGIARDIIFFRPFWTGVSKGLFSWGLSEIILMKESHKQVNYEQKILWYLDFVSLWNKYKRKSNNKVFSQSSSPNFFLPLIIRSIVFWGSFPSLLLFDFFSYFSTLLQHILHIFLLFHGAFLEGHSDISDVNPQSRQSA